MDVEGSYSKKNNTIGRERERERGERERGSTLKGKRERREEKWATTTRRYGRPRGEVEWG